MFQCAQKTMLEKYHVKATSGFIEVKSTMKEFGEQVDKQVSRCEDRLIKVNGTQQETTDAIHRTLDTVRRCEEQLAFMKRARMAETKFKQKLQTHNASESRLPTQQEEESKEETQDDHSEVRQLIKESLDLLETKLQTKIDYLKEKLKHSGMDNSLTSPGRK